MKRKALFKNVVLHLASLLRSDAILDKQLFTSVLLKKVAGASFSKFPEKYLCCIKFLFNKITGLETSTILKKILRPVNFAKYFRASSNFFEEALLATVSNYSKRFWKL